jgi:hypothetical protein
MRKRRGDTEMIYRKIPIILMAAAMSTSTLVFANEEEGELEEAELFFELNDTDGDLGMSVNYLR